MARREYACLRKASDKGREPVMRFVRLEHYGCHNAGHGPFNNGWGALGYDFPWDIACVQSPSFGTYGSAPNNIQPHERCAVTWDQFPRWWSQDRSEVARQADHWERAGWMFVEWESDTTRVDNSQILYDPSQAFPVRIVPWSEVITNAPLHPSTRY